MHDVIRLNNMSFYGYHGVSAAERETGRQFEVDCELEVDLADAARSDRLADTIDYSQVYDVVRDVVQGKAYSLVESLAADMAKSILERFAVYRVTLRIRKLHPPLNGPIKSIEVELSRQQPDPSKLLNNRQP
ncbi:MAG: dihydroneopterin aldolase [bacterium]